MCAFLEKEISDLDKLYHTNAHKKRTHSQNIRKNSLKKVFCLIVQQFLSSLKYKLVLKQNLFKKNSLSIIIGIANNHEQQNLKSKTSKLSGAHAELCAYY